ncbi:hypothetical protein CBS101457_003668 [Exobasidium rhododendri]|nr:hypothetical protein CBS101457_003668 [Exobasidium rhododendri]
MRSALIATVAAATMAAAAPMAVEKRALPGQADIDVVILNYALTLEHLEDHFYHDVLPSAAAFKKAGYAPYVHERFLEIAGHEKSHVAFLTAALGSQAVAACEYDFGITTPQSFVATSQLLEGVGVSAYLGAAQNITNPAYLTAAGSILTTESRHSAWVQSSAALTDAFGNPYDTPLDFNQTYSLAAPLIKNCPSSNAPLPVVAFPAATLAAAPTKLGQSVTFKSAKLVAGDMIGFLNGLNTVVVAQTNGKVTLPKEVGYGRTYAVILKKGATTISDENTKAGPVAFDILPSASEGAAYYSS